MYLDKSATVEKKVIDVFGKELLHGQEFAWGPTKVSGISHLHDLRLGV